MDKAPVQDEAGLRRAEALIRSAFARRPRLPELAAAAGLSRFYFQRRFKEHFGETPLQLCFRLQIEHAKDLLRKGVSVGDVARRCGFSHLPHFSTRFKQATGSRPSHWLQDRRQKPAAGPGRQKAGVRKS